MGSGNNTEKTGEVEEEGEKKQEGVPYQQNPITITRAISNQALAASGKRREERMTLSVRFVCVSYIEGGMRKRRRGASKIALEKEDGDFRRVSGARKSISVYPKFRREGKEIG